tara:strand:- start:4015 stop:4719 length:705 start_codon:yes stop_codon:yes gene_type:complete
MEKKITIIIPCYNEVKSIEKIIKKIKKIDIEKQIILVDDNSSDGSIDLIEEKLIEDIDLFLKHDRNYGKGKCIITAKPFILNDLIIIQDADLEYNPENYFDLIEPILNKRVNVVYGSRVLNSENYQKHNSFLSSFRIFGNFVLTKISNLINNQNLTDAHTCYKVFAKNVFDNITLKEEGFNFCPEITTKIANLEERIEEVPIDYYGRSKSEGKKIRFWHAIQAVYTLVKYKINK